MKSRCSFILKAGLALVLCLILLVGTMATGLAKIVYFAYTGAEAGHRIYMCPHYLNNGDIHYENYSYFKVWVKDNGGGEGQKDYSVEMTNTGQTIGGYPIYTAEIYEYYGGWSYIQFWAFSDSEYTDKIDHYDVTDGTWVFANGITNKVYDGYYDNDHHWVTPVWDIYYSLHGTLNGVNHWDDGGLKLTDTDGDGIYTTDVTLQRSDEMKVYVSEHVDGSSPTTYLGHQSANYQISTVVDGSTLSSTGSNIEGLEGNYTFCFKPGDTNYAYALPKKSADYYLTGYINGKDVAQRHTTLGFTQTSTGKYTLTYNFNSGTDQYLTVLRNSDSQAYHPQNHESGSGIIAYTIDGNPTGDTGNNKWKITAPAGTTATFTWDTTTSPKPTLSWVNNAKFKVTYSGREGGDSKTVYLVGGALRSSEVLNSCHISYTSPDDKAYWNERANTVIKDNLGIFMNDFNISSADIKVDETDNNQLNIDISEASTSKKVNVTAYYPASIESAFTNSSDYYYSATANNNDEDDYNVYSVVNLSGLVSGKTPADKHFYAWMEYFPDKAEGSKLGRIVSTKQNYNFKATGDITIIAVYKSGSTAISSDYEDKWIASIDENRVSAEYESATYAVNPSGGKYYNDFIVRFSNYRTNASLSEFLAGDGVSGSYEYGVLLIYKPEDWVGAEGGTGLNTLCTDTGSGGNLEKFVNKLSGNQVGTHNGFKVKAIELHPGDSSMSNYNRINLALKSDVSTFKNAQYGAVAYLKYTAAGAGTPTYVFSDPVYGTYN